ncbi:MAG: hypothetical protein EXQ94_05210 [Alphaproteobacteria bacterium]|nr:hypothetical protein [Alphaproteobacteria bacterium]
MSAVILESAACEETSWHDNLIYAFRFDVGDSDRGEWWGDMVLDIDHILEWVRGNDGRIGFRVAPATLVFQDVANLQVTLGQAAGDHPRTLGELAIDRVTKVAIPWPWSDARLPYYRWRIGLNAPAGGVIGFLASGFTQTLRAEPVLLEQQRWSPGDRPALPARSR